MSKLHQIIDRDRLFHMLYSGVEDAKNFNLLYDLGIRNFLMSYHYINGKNLNMSQYDGLEIKFFIDSGAFTYMSNPKYMEKTVEEWELHIIDYLAWARENKEYIFALASLDIELLVGGEQVQEWNEKYFEPFMLETGIPVCFVWHSEATLLTWEEYCQRYPYVGVSWGTDDFADGTGGLKAGISMLKTAEKYNTVVHGMAMTRTSMLTKLPFYTSDSTTWMVGVQYGEVNYWNGTKMSRLKKDKWKGEYLERLVKLANLDRDRFLNEESSEMIKANVVAFIQAEKYVQEKLKPRMYWLRPEKAENNRETFEFPSVEWLQGETDYDNLEEYAKQMNINPELKRDELIDHIYNLTIFLNNGNPDYDELVEACLTEECVKPLHRYYVNTVCGSLEEQIQELEDFFTNVLEGNETKLLYLGTNFDVSVKERDKYIEEEEYEQVDVSEQEYTKLVSDLGLLPSPDSSAPEIDELDKEIFDQTGYAVVRDDKGRFLKGQKTVRKPKHIYSEKYPKLACSTCYAAQTCPEFKEGYVCAFNKMFKRFDCRKTEDILEAMQGMVNLNMERMQREAIFETLNGGMAGGTLTNLIDQNMRLLMNMKQVYSANEAVIKQVRTVQADGTVQETTQVNSNGGSGVMEMLMKNMMNKDKKEGELDINDVIDVKPEDIKEIN